ncbi:MAG: neutral/alkaline non-lysosomal ceramidase N-terminal domain-containing protein [bacterium]
MKSRRTFKLVLWSLLCFPLILLACNGAKIAVTLKPPQAIEPSGAFLAGAAKVDITPPPGYAMGAFAIAGKFSHGWWTQLYARSIYLEDSEGHRVALVSCDLWAMPAGLADKVAEIVSERIDGARADSSYLGREQIIIAATHTHHGPANFSSSEAYNAAASPQSGFDESLLQFLANRIALAITRAIESKKPAVVKKAAVDLTGLSRNRSFAAFERNPHAEQQEILGRVPVEIANTLFDDNVLSVVPSAGAYRAIDPTLTILKVETAEKAPMAVAAFFAVHPNVMGPKTEVYSSDIFGVASTLVEHHLRSEFPNENSVVAIFNGAEGDVSANWKQQDRQNTLKIGRELAEGIILALASATETVSGEIEYRYKTVGIADKVVEDLHADATALCQSKGPLRTAKKPYPGVATLGGAEEGRTLFYGLGFREGFTSASCNSRQGYKLFSVEKLLDNVLPKDQKPLLRDLVSDIVKENVKLPKEIPLAVYSIGAVRLATLPGEFTVALGRRMTRSLSATLRVPEEDLLLIGLANEYLSYFTTPLEYNAQHYEGASTMYGQVAGLFVEQELLRVAQMNKNTADYNLKRSYDAGPAAPKGFGTISTREPWVFAEALENLLQDPTTGKGERNFPQFVWWYRPVLLGDEREQEATTAAQRVNPVVSIEQLTDKGWELLKVADGEPSGGHKITLVESDTSSLNFVTVIDSVTNDSARWRSVWLAPATINPALTVRFNVSTPEQKQIHSEAFQIESVLQQKQAAHPIMTAK